MIRTSMRSDLTGLLVLAIVVAGCGGKGSTEASPVQLTRIGHTSSVACRNVDDARGIYDATSLTLIDPCKTVSGRVRLIEKSSEQNLRLELKLDRQFEKLLNNANRVKSHGNLVIEVLQTDLAACNSSQLQWFASLAPTYAQCSHSRIATPQFDQHVYATGSFVLDRRQQWHAIYPAWRVAPQPPNEPMRKSSTSNRAGERATGVSALKSTGQSTATTKHSATVTPSPSSIIGSHPAQASNTSARATTTTTSPSPSSQPYPDVNQTNLDQTTPATSQVSTTTTIQPSATATTSTTTTLFHNEHPRPTVVPTR